MLNAHYAGILLGAALVWHPGAMSATQEAAASGAAKTTAAGETEAKTEKGRIPELSTKSSGEAAADSAASAQIERDLASLKSGTAISTELDQTIDARKAKAGDVVSAKVTKDIKHEGRTVIRKGDRLLGRVNSAEAGGEGKAGSELGVTFDRLARGNAEYQLNTVVSSVISTSGGMGANGMPPMDDAMMIPGPVSGGGGGGGRAGGGSLLGGATSTAGSAVSATGSAAGGLAGNVGGTASSAIGSTGTAVGASEHSSAQSGSRVGLSTPMRDIRLSSQTSASQSGESTSMLGARRGNLRLESGTRMKFKVSNQTEAKAAKK